MITTLYAALLALLFVCLSIHVILGRFQYQLSLGDGGIPDMASRIRAHANFAEYAPFALLLLFFVDDVGSSAFLIHALGIMLLTGRFFHAIALTKPAAIPYARQMGMGLTFAMMILCTVILLWRYISGF